MMADRIRISLPSHWTEKYHGNHRTRLGGNTTCDFGPASDLTHNLRFGGCAGSEALNMDSASPATASASCIGVVLRGGCGVDRQRRLRGAVSIAVPSQTSTAPIAPLPAKGRERTTWHLLLASTCSQARGCFFQTLVRKELSFDRTSEVER